MYLNYFGLVERPFSIAPDPQYLYMSAKHREAMAHLSYGLQQGGCFIVLTGEVGTGKTTLCRNLLADLPDNVDVALILNPSINRRELLETVCDELKVDVEPGVSKKKMLDSINQHLLKTYADNRHTVLIIDEAQLLSHAVLEQVRLLTNLETTKAKLLQIILIGQPELNDVLSRNELRQLSQRVTARYHLPAISQHDIQDYVNFRLSVAGCRKPLFSAQALRALYKYSGGIPRKINVLADHALLAAYANSDVMVESTTIKQAAKDVFITSNEGPKTEVFNPLVRWIAGAALLLMLNLGLWWWFVAENKTPTISPTAQQAHLPASDRRTSAAETDAEGIEEIADEVLVDEASVQPDLDSQALKRDVVSDEDAGSDGLTTIIRDQGINPGSVVISDEYLDEEPQVSIIEPTDQPDPPAYLASTDFARVLEASSDQTGRILAFRNLAAAWDIDLSSEILGPLCDEIERQSAVCLSTSNWGAVVRFNRPAIMNLMHLGSEHRVILYKLDEGVASVLVGEQSYDLPVSELRDRWNNSAVIFWRPGSRGDQVQQQGDISAQLPAIRASLNAVFAELDMPQLTDTTSLIYDTEISDKVANLQQRFGLTIDGIIGRETYLLINELLSPEQVPVLTQRRDAVVVTETSSLNEGEADRLNFIPIENESKQ